MTEGFQQKFFQLHSTQNTIDYERIQRTFTKEVIIAEVVAIYFAEIFKNALNTINTFHNNYLIKCIF